MASGDLLVVAFYTPAYLEEAELLSASLQRAGMAHDVVALPDLGTWDANTARKPHFIRGLRSQHIGPLLYVDADAFVHCDCSAYFEGLAEDGVDFGAHWFAGPAKGHNFERDNCACLRGEPCSQPHRLLSGTLYFGDTAGARALLTAWVELNAVCRGVGWKSGGGQRNLWALVTAHGRALNVARLTGRYTYVFDKAEGYPAGEPCVIEHTIASRDHRGSRRETEPRAARIAELKELVGC